MQRVHDVIFSHSRDHRHVRNYNDSLERAAQRSLLSFSLFPIIIIKNFLILRMYRYNLIVFRIPENYKKYYPYKNIKNRYTIKKYKDFCLNKQVK